MTVIRVAPDAATGGARLTFRYDALVVELIKTVSAGARRWDPAGKSWWVAPLEVADLIALLEAAGHHVVGTWTGTGRTPPHTSRAAVDGWADALFQAVGAHRVDAVFRAVLRVLHPDVATGDTQLCQQLNAARDRQAALR